MPKRFLAPSLGLMAALVFSIAVHAQTSRPAKTGQSKTASPVPDLSGIWVEAGAPGSGIKLAPGAMNFRRFTKEDPPLQPWALEKFKYNREGVTDPNESGLDERDPEESCYPIGPTRIYAIPRPIEIVQTPRQILLLSEWDHTVRRIYLDGREHPPGYPYGWEGHSIGKWDGDTLVIDTIDTRPETWVDGIGTPHTEELHVVERLRRVKPDTLEVDVQFDDPKAYTKTWGGKKTFILKPKFEILDHVNCEEWLEMGKHRALPQ